jgi:hypothetical protein
MITMFHECGFDLVQLVVPDDSFDFLHTVAFYLKPEYTLPDVSASSAG